VIVHFTGNSNFEIQQQLLGLIIVFDHWAMRQPGAMTFVVVENILIPAFPAGQFLQKEAQAYFSAV